MLKTAKNCICDYVQNNPNFFYDIEFKPRETYGTPKSQYCFNYLIKIDKFDFDLQKYTDDINVFGLHRTYRCDDYKIYVSNLFNIVFTIIEKIYKNKTDDEFFKHIFNDYFQKLYKTSYNDKYICIYFDMLMTLFDNSNNTKTSIKKVEVKYRKCLKKFTEIEEKSEYFFLNKNKYVDYEEYLFYKEMDISHSIYE